MRPETFMTQFSSAMLLASNSDVDAGSGVGSKRPRGAGAALDKRADEGGLVKKARPALAPVAVAAVGGAADKSTDVLAGAGGDGSADGSVLISSEKQMIVEQACFSEALEACTRVKSSTCLILTHVQDEILRRLQKDLSAAGYALRFPRAGSLDTVDFTDSAQTILLFDPTDFMFSELKRRLAETAAFAASAHRVIAVYSKPTAAKKITGLDHFTLYFDFTTSAAYHFCLFNLMRVLSQNLPHADEYLQLIFSELCVKRNNIPRLTDSELSILITDPAHDKEADNLLRRIVSQKKLLLVRTSAEWDGLYKLFEAYESRSETSRELPLLDRLVQIQIDSEPRDKVQRMNYVRVLHRGSALYALENNFAQVAVCLERALALLETEEKNSHYGILQLELARAYRQLGKLDEAIAYAEAAYKLLNATLGRYDMHTQDAAVVRDELVSEQLKKKNVPQYAPMSLFGGGSAPKVTSVPPASAGAGAASGRSSVARR